MTIQQIGAYKVLVAWDNGKAHAEIRTERAIVWSHTNYPTTDVALYAAKVAIQNMEAM